MIEPTVIGDATLYLGDCLDVLRALPDGAVDAILTDPPYCSGSVSEAKRTRAIGQGLRSENLRRFGWFKGDNMGTAGLLWLIRSVAVEASRLLKSSGSLLVFCDWRMMASLQPAIESAGLRFQNLVVWDKGHMGLGVGFRAQHELVLHFTAGSPEYHDRAVGNVIKSKRVGSLERVHQTEKPVALLTTLLRVSCPSGGVCLDPFMGSGTTGVACLQTGRKFIGVEIDPTYHAIACARLRAIQPALPGLSG